MVLPDMTLQLLAGQQKNAATATLELEPGERHAWPLASDLRLGVAHLDDQDPSRREVLRRFFENDAHRIETLLARRQREARFVFVLGGQRAHLALPDVGWIRDDDIVPTAFEGREMIRFQEADTPRETQISCVFLGELECRIRNIRPLDARLRQVVRTGERDATAARAEIEYALHARGVDPRSKLLLDEFGDRRARNERSGIRAHR